MKSLFFLIFAGLSTICFAQVYPVDFEVGGNGAAWTWTVFENDTNPAVEIVANPDPSGINKSNTVAKITALALGQPFAGCETMHGADVGTFSLSPDNAYVAMMVYKSVISDVGFKFATPEGASTGEIKIANTVVDQWERLVFDFTAVIGEPSSNGIDQIIVFPDFQDRDTDNIVYFDNIIFGDSSILELTDQDYLSVEMVPNPASDSVRIIASALLQQIAIHDSSGRLIFEAQPNNAELSLDLTSYPAGMYFLTLRDNNRTSIKKLLID